MATITTLFNTNTNTTIVLNQDASKAEQFRDAVVKGCDLGKTSFFYLITGKQQESKGWVLKQVEETVETIAASSAEELVALLAGKNVESHVSETNDNMVSVHTAYGRIRVRICKTDLSLKFYPSKGFDSSDIAKLGFEVTKNKSSYSRLAAVSVQEFLSKF